MNNKVKKKITKHVSHNRSEGQTWEGGLLKMPERSEAGRSFLSVCRDLAFILAIYLYFVGFVYIRAFYNEFGLSISSADVQVYYPIIYSYEVLTKLTWWTWPVVFVVLGLLSYCVFRYLQKIRFAAFVVIGVFLLVFLGYEANLKGSEHARAFRAGYGTQAIRLTFNPAAKRQLPRDLLELNDNGRLWLLSATNARYLVFYQPAALDNELPYGRVFAIPATDVTVAETEVRNDKSQN